MRSAERSTSVWEGVRPREQSAGPLPGHAPAASPAAPVEG